MVPWTTGSDNSKAGTREMGVGSMAPVPRCPAEVLLPWREGQGAGNRGGGSAGGKGTS